MSKNKNIHVSQVHLEKPCAIGDWKFTMTDVVWIPSTLAKLGKVLRIYDKGVEEWSDGWVVKEVYESRIYQEVLEDESNYKTQREASDSYDNQGPVATAFMKG